MSRHELIGRDPRHKLVLGWDPPLETYFVQIYDTTLPEEENPIVWLGADLRWVPLGRVKLAAAPYVDVTDEVLAELAEDRAKNR